MIEELLEITKKLNITIFNTHSSKLLKNLNDPRVTIGIHPNLQKEVLKEKILIQLKII